jgi:hypothetical protein
MSTPRSAASSGPGPKHRAAQANVVNNRIDNEYFRLLAHYCPLLASKFKPQFDRPVMGSYACASVKCPRTNLALATAAAIVLSRSPVAAAPDILPLAQVKPGMVGEARTVFQGTRPEGFKVRVVSILRNFMPKQDIILVRSDDPRVAISGIAAGMSGSPVYVDGKLMGAIAYGWAFAKEPIAGVTPIEAMLEAPDRPGRPPLELAAQAAQDDPLPSAGSDGDKLRPVGIPLAVAGVSEAAFAYLSETVAPLGLHPVRAGGAGRVTAAAEPADVALMPGAAVGVGLIGGDMSTTAMGTLTYSDGKQILAFGHSLFGIGRVKLPMVSGEIHAIIPSLSSSMKMASPIREIGSITEDSRVGVVGVLGERASKIPVRVQVVSAGVRKPDFSVEIARHRRLIPMLATVAVSSALTDLVPDVTDMVADVTTRLFVRGFDPLELRDQVASRETLAPRLLAMSHGMRALAELLANPFAPAVIDRIDVSAKVEYRNDGADVVAVSLVDDEVRAGHALPLRVTLRPYAGSEVVETVVVDVPRALAGKTMKIEVAGGSKVQPEVPRPENLQGLIRNLRTYYTASSLVVSLTTKDDGVALHGQLLRTLPPSALDTLRPVNQSRRADAFHVVRRTAFGRGRIISGHREITVKVHEPDE